MFTDTPDALALSYLILGSLSILCIFRLLTTLRLFRYATTTFFLYVLYALTGLCSSSNNEKTPNVGIRGVCCTPFSQYKDVATVLLSTLGFSFLAADMWNQYGYNRFTADTYTCLCLSPVVLYFWNNGELFVDLTELIMYSGLFVYSLVCLLNGNVYGLVAALFFYSVPSPIHGLNRKLTSTLQIIINYWQCIFIYLAMNAILYAGYCCHQYY